MVPDGAVQAAEAAVQDLKELGQKLVSNDGSRPIDTAVIVGKGEVSAALEDVIRTDHIDLVVLGTHGRTGLEKITLGSVAEHFFRRASCPVLTVGPSSSPDWPQRELGAEKAILCPMDSADASLAALTYAVSIAKRTHSKLVLLDVAESVPQGERTPVIGDAVDAAAKDELRRVRTQWLRSLLPEGLGVESEARLAFGPPVAAILAEAATTASGLIVLGLHHKSFFPPPAHMPSSTAYEVVIGAQCPVLTVRSS